MRLRAMLPLFFAAHALVAQPPGTPATGTLGGTVFDSSAAAPLAGATVLLTHATRADVAPLAVVADSGGRFTARDLAPGRWIVTFLDRSAEEYGVAPVPREVSVVEGGAATVALALPGARALRAALCGRTADSLGVMVGSVRDADGGDWVRGAAVTVSWRVFDLRGGVRLATRRVPVVTGADGTFRACGLPSGDALAVRAIARDTATGRLARSGELFVVVEPGGITRLQVGVGHATTSAVATSGDDDVAGTTRLVGHARLAGVVSDEQGRPRADARVVIVGTGQQLVTGEAGTFRFDSLPAGSWTVEARAIGVTPVRATVQLSSAELATTSLVFSKWTPSLDRVQVYGRMSAEARFMDDFLARRERGLGKFITAAEIESRSINQLSQLLYAIPGVRVRPSAIAGRSPTIEGRGGCRPDVFVNGLRIPDGEREVDTLVRPREILAIEVHDDVNGVPSAFGSTSGCLVVAIWTRK